MKHAVIVAHPNPDSFTASMARAYVVAAHSVGHETCLRDLYAMDFDPRLRLEELPTERGVQAAPDVVHERGLLADVQVFTFVYPLWFDAPPAMLKGYLERVFGLGFGYGPGLRGNEPLLEGRRMFSISSSGAPTQWVQETGSWRALRTLFDGHFAKVCGLEVVDHLHFGDITLGIREDVVEACAQAVRAAVLNAFGAASSVQEAG